MLAKAIQEQQEEINQLKSKTSTSSPIIHDESSLTNDLSYYSGQLLTGIWHFVEIVTDKITATLGVFKMVETEDLEANIATINNLEMKDSATGEVYCVRMINGEFDKQIGRCKKIDVQSSSTQEDNSTTTPAVDNPPIEVPPSTDTQVSTSTDSVTP